MLRVVLQEEDWFSRHCGMSFFVVPHYEVRSTTRYVV